MNFKKLNFWTVFALVVSSQIGSGIFVLPLTLSPYGFYSFFAWIISGLGAISLALVFAKLCSSFSKASGLHIYVKETLGDFFGFFTGFTYWVVSWVSSTSVVIGGVGYLNSILNINDLFLIFLLQLFFLFLSLIFNYFGYVSSNKIEKFLTIIKIIPLIILPIISLFYFKYENLIPTNEINFLSLNEILSRIVFLTFWGFIGVEAATASSDKIENPSKNIPKALIFGTITVSLVYLINNIGIIGTVPNYILKNSGAPYAEVVKIIFGGNWHSIISFIATIICLTSLNAWMMASSQTAIILAEENYLPKIFKKIGLWMSGIGISILLFMTIDQGIAKQVLMIIDFSVTSFIYIYIICCFAFLKIIYKNNENLIHYIYGLFALIFCLWMIFKSSVYVLLIASLFTLSGTPFYIYYKIKN